MAKNDFKAFATDRNANVITQEEWEALPALLSGFTAGKASSSQVNKVIRQASFIAAALAQFVSDKTQRDVLDNGDLPGFVELLGSGFAVEYLSRKNPFGDIKSDGTVETALENLGLGEAAKRNVGTGANQIPDMGSFTLSVSGTGYQKLPSGFILQWGSIGAPGIAQDVVTHFPIAFPNRCLRVLVSQDYTPDSGAVGYIACAGFSPDPVKFISRASTPGLGASFLALGC
ncbi:TPA: gp53-like domain-containing protein [Escherichia coli]